MRALEIFDFDWTLFRSPSAPQDVAKKSFIHSPKSLMPPHVPLRPGGDFWIEEIVREIKASQRRRGTVTALITARRGKTKDRILHLLGQRNICPDMVELRSASFQRDKDRFHFKRNKLISILENNQNMNEVIMWDDEQGHLDNAQDVSKRKGIAFVGNLVTEPGRPVL